MRFRDVEVYTPFAVDSIEHSIHKTYLDTTGRHTIILKKARCTEDHAKTVYVGFQGVTKDGGRANLFIRSYTLTPSRL